MSDVISILELLQETGEGPLKGSVDEALLTSLLSAFISNHTHKMTAKQQEFTEKLKLVFCVAGNVEATTEARSEP